MFFSGSKYCPLLESEGGLEVLKAVSGVCHPGSYCINSRVQSLIDQIIKRCQKFRQDPGYHSPEVSVDFSDDQGSNDPDVGEEADSTDAEIDFDSDSNSHSDDGLY